MQKIYLGVEGGATKSTAILEKDGKITKRVGKPLNYHSLEENEVEDNLRDLLMPLLSRAKGYMVHAVFGLSGLDTKKDEIVYKRISRRILPKGSKFNLVNDAKVAIEALCPNETKRILVISGTGSNVYGENGKAASRSLGWGFLLGDEGSGFQTGLKALKAAFQSWDGRGKKTKLERLVLAHSKAKSMEDFIPKIYAIKDMKSYVAGFAPLVDKALKENDKVAVDIRKDVLNDLLSGTIAVVDKLNLQNQSFAIGLVGSNWRMPQLKESFEKYILTKYPLARFSQIKEEGALGAIALAKELYGN